MVHEMRISSDSASEAAETLMYVHDRLSFSLLEALVVGSAGKLVAFVVVLSSGSGVVISPVPGRGDSQKAPSPTHTIAVVSVRPHTRTCTNLMTTICMDQPMFKLRVFAHTTQ